MSINKKEGYQSYDTDSHTPGSSVKVDHCIYSVETDISKLVEKPLDELNTMYDELLKKETAAYEKIVQAAKDWEPTAFATRQVERAIQYVETPPPEHSSNKWCEDRNGYKSISNAVYKMSYHIFEHKSWRTDNIRWDLRWSVYTNSFDSCYNLKVAGQDKSFSSKEAMEKYLQGRINAFSHLFTEISPPIPDHLIRPFCVNNRLLPGYITESEAKAKKELETKPSVRDKLKSLKEETKSSLKKSPTHNRNEQLLE